MSNRLTQEVIQNALEFVSKGGAWITYILIGLIGKLGWDITTRKKLSFRYVFGTSCMGCFVGFISSKYCITHAPNAGAYIVPVLTLASRDVTLFFFMIDWRKILGLLFKTKIQD